MTAARRRGREAGSILACASGALTRSTAAAAHARKGSLRARDRLLRVRSRTRFIAARCLTISAVMAEAAQTDRKLIVVPDANMLIHGKAFANLPWAELGRDEIEVLYVPTVVREVDALKTQSGRPNKLARQVSADVRALRKSDDKAAVIREGAPRVTKRLATDLVSKKFHRRLKLDHADQALINYCLSLKAAGHDVLLLTDDTICATIADDVGLPVQLVDDHWLRDPEPDESDRENARLKEQLRRATSSEPQIETKFASLDGSPLTALEAALRSWPALSRDEVDALMKRVEAGCPMAMSFERPKQAAHSKLLDDLALINGLKRKVYTPATQAEIEAYKERGYPKWLGAVRKQLEGLHHTLEGGSQWPRFLIHTANNGSRPAEDALIKVQALGGIEIENLVDRDDEEGVSGRSPDLVLPPEPPRGKTDTIDPFDFGLGLSKHALDPAHLRSFNLPSAMQVRRDKDRFYWRCGRDGPTDSFELECGSWRHSEGPLEFRVAVRPHAVKDTAGAIELIAHAANLSVPHSAKLPVRLTTAAGSTIRQAEALVEALIRRAGSEGRL
jgi:hypothetical protein